MSSPRYPGRDLSLERLGDRDGLRPAPLAEAAQVRSLEESASSLREYRVGHQALVDAAFTAPGVVEWLAMLRRRVAALVAGQDAARPRPVASEAIRPADAGTGRI